MTQSEGGRSLPRCHHDALSRCHRANEEMGDKRRTNEPTIVTSSAPASPRHRHAEPRHATPAVATLLVTSRLQCGDDPCQGRPLTRPVNAVRGGAGCRKGPKSTKGRRLEAMPPGAQSGCAPSQGDPEGLRRAQGLRSRLPRSSWPKLGSAGWSGSAPGFALHGRGGAGR